MEQPKLQADLSNYIPQIDGIRCIAIALVLFGHWVYYSWFWPADIVIAGSGANLFFVLSGFLITRIFLVQKIGLSVDVPRLLQSFYLRRVLRIFPLYYVVLLAGLLLAVPGARESGTRIMTFILNIPNSKLDLPNAGYYMHLWSLSVQVQYYIIFPVLMIITPTKKLRLLFLSMLFIGIASRVLIYCTDASAFNKEWASYNFTTCCFDCFAAGSLLAWYSFMKPDALVKIVTSRWILFSVTALFIIMAVLKMKNEAAMLPNIFLRLSFSAIAFCFIGATMMKKLPRFIYLILSNRAVVYIGRISYGIYVFHFFMPLLVRKLGLIYGQSQFSVLIHAALYTIFAIMAAALSWEFFEHPINKLKTRFPYYKEKIYEKKPEQVN